MFCHLLQLFLGNWKMNLSQTEADTLLNELLQTEHTLNEHQEAIFAVPAI